MTMDGMVEMEPSEVRNRLEKLGIRTSKRLGQHFLLDSRVAHRAVEYAAIGEDDRVLEIGPGLGILTRVLVERCEKVVAVERDGRLMDLVEAENIEYIHGDILEIDLPSFDKVVSNIPYSISSPLTFRLLGPGVDFDLAVIMYQKEFAERLASGPGTKQYSRLSVNAYVRADIELLEEIPRSLFHPSPKVDSCLVRLEPRDPPFETGDWDLFHEVVRVAFGQRRKKLRNSLKNGARVLGIVDEKVFPFDDIPNSNRRPEELPPENFGEITDFVLDHRGGRD